MFDERYVDSAIDALATLGSENIAKTFDKLLKKKRGTLKVVTDPTLEAD